MKLTQATCSQFDEVRTFYHHLIDMMENEPYGPEWKKEIYPTNEQLFEAIQKKQLFYVKLDNEIVASMVINHDYGEEYDLVQWQCNASREEIMIIHLLGVLPTFQRKGIARFLIDEAIHLAKQSNQKTIRLDVLGTNLPAHEVYLKLGFKCCDTIQMYYEDTGTCEYMLYEYVL